MIRIATLVLTLAQLGGAGAFAQTPDQLLKLRQAFEALHVNVNPSCPLVEKPALPPSGGHIPATKCTTAAFATATRVPARVYRVVDGDTVHVYIGQSVYAVRMLGMDTPELHFLARAQPTWGLRAGQSLATMLRPGDPIVVEFDRVKCDRYGRILVHVFKNGVNINLAQIQAGYAANYCIAPNLKYCDAYADAYVRAKAAHLGIHSDSCLVTPYVWRRGMQGHPMDKPVRNRRNGALYKPSDYYMIPVEDRVFYPATTSSAMEAAEMDLSD